MSRCFLFTCTVHYSFIDAISDNAPKFGYVQLLTDFIIFNTYVVLLDEETITYINALRFAYELERSESSPAEVAKNF